MAKATWVFTLTKEEVRSLHQSLTSGGQVTLIDDHTGVTMTLRTKDTDNECLRCSALKGLIGKLDNF